MVFFFRFQIRIRQQTIRWMRESKNDGKLSMRHKKETVKQRKPQTADM